MRQKQQALTIRQSVFLDLRWYRAFAFGCFAFLLAFLASATLTPVASSSASQSVLAEITSGPASVAVSGSSTVNLAVSSPNSSGKLVSTTDTLSIDASTAPDGYSLYLSMDNAYDNGNRLYLGGDTSAAYLTPNYAVDDSTGEVADIAFGSEASLKDNSWGFTVDSAKHANNEYAAVPLYNNPALISSAAESGTYSKDIYYAVKVNTNMIAGSYTGTILYTIISDSIKDDSGIKSITPNLGTANVPNPTLHLQIQLPAIADSIADLGAITTKIGTATNEEAGTVAELQTCTNPTYQLSYSDTYTNDESIDTTDSRGDVLTIACIAPSFATSGGKDVVVSIQRYGQDYVKESAYTYYAQELTMQDFTAEDCNKLSVSTAELDGRVTLKDARDGKTYRISKLADGNCWMSQNLALDPIDEDGNNRTLTTTDTDIDTAEIPDGSYTFPDNTLTTSNVESLTAPKIMNKMATNTTTSCSDSSPYCVINDEPYGSQYNWIAATAGQGVTNINTVGVVKSSICPKGWQMPNVGSSIDAEKSYRQLMYAVLGVTATRLQNDAGGIYAQKAQQAPLYLPMSGQNGGSGGRSGVYWTRYFDGYIYSNQKPYVQAFSFYSYNNGASDAGTFLTKIDYQARWFYSVRCVFGG